MLNQNTFPVMMNDEGFSRHRPVTMCSCLFQHILQSHAVWNINTVSLLNRVKVLFQLREPKCKNSDALCAIFLSAGKRCASFCPHSFSNNKLARRLCLWATWNTTGSHWNDVIPQENIWLLKRIKRFKDMKPKGVNNELQQYNWEGKEWGQCCHGCQSVWGIGEDWKTKSHHLHRTSPSVSDSLSHLMPPCARTELL